MKESISHSFPKTVNYHILPPHGALGNPRQDKPGNNPRNQKKTTMCVDYKPVHTMVKDGEKKLGLRSRRIFKEILSMDHQSRSSSTNKTGVKG